MKLSLASSFVVFCNLIFATQSFAQDGAGTKFRGFYINMPRSEIEKASLQDFEIKLEEKKAIVAPKGVNIPDSDLGTKDNFLGGVIASGMVPASCATIFFDGDKKVERMLFDKCFFSAKDLDFEAFAQAIVNSYKISSLNCKETSQPPVRACIGPSPDCRQIPQPPSKVCSGPMPTGEWLTLDSNASIIEATMTVERRAASQRPKFD
ncbi:hypothetical protein [Nitrobacter sp. JJSN]|uniref:hypothetical protein n=1 Tax=Nitrobacter sp. JJSN TaxID=3453033 RepID=UPI003F76D45D